VIRSALALVLILMLAACGTSPGGPTPTPETISIARPKRLATVELSPTPDAAERQATRFAASATPDALARVTPSPTPTAYIGVFLGNSAASVPVIDDPAAVLAAPTITPVPTRCLLPPDTETLGDRWQTNPVVVRGLGCAIEGLTPFFGEAQVFENGAIYTRDNGQAWAILPGDPGRFWFVEAAPEVESTDVEPSPGLLVPDGAIGALWRSRPDIQQGLGFAVLSAAPVGLGFQRFEGGTLFYDGEGGQVFALLIDGAAYGPY